MLKFRFKSKFRRWRGVNLEKCFKNVKIIGFLDIFLDILRKMMGNLGEEHVKRGASILRGQNWKNCLRFPWKNDSSDPTFPPVPP